MGTSTSYKTPTTPQWGPIKRQITKLSHQSGPLLPEVLGGVMNRFISAHGGTAGFGSHAGVAGVSGAASGAVKRAATFFSTVASQGISSALREVGLEGLIGKPTRELLDGIIDYLGGNAVTGDDTDARQAICDLFEELLAEASTSEEVEQIMAGIINAEKLNLILEKFFVYYLYAKFCREFFERLVEKAGHPRATEMMTQIHDYLRSVVEHELHERDLSSIDWHGSQGSSIIESILSETLNVFSR